MQGQIVQIISNDYYVNCNDQKYICKARGKLKYNNITPQVGDYVIFDTDENIITEIVERKNSLDRPNVSNVDQAFIITSLKHPDFSTNLLDKLLVLCSINNIKPVICLTKKDLLSRNEYKQLKPIISYYKKIGYKVLYNTQYYKIKKQFKNKTTVFTGQTGSGKSSLMNKLDKTLNFETNEISEALGRGKHTTRYVTLVELFKGKVLDTPGFSALDLASYSNEEIKHGFIEFIDDVCAYKDCMHINEDDCGIKERVLKNIILKHRYDNYKKFIEKR